MSDKLTGRIEQWVLGYRLGDEVILWGFIYDDAEGRWPDGTWFHTSGIKQDDFKEGQVVHTRNSTYLLGSPMREALENRSA